MKQKQPQKSGTSCGSAVLTGSVAGGAAMKIVLNTDPESATFVDNIFGWVSRNGLFYGDNKDSELIARYDGCTHVACKYCGKPAKKPYTACDPCREKNRIARFNKLPVGNWDGSAMLYSETEDKYFYHTDDVEEYAEENDMSMADMRVLICELVKYRLIDDDYWSDCLPEEGELPDIILKAVDKLNELLSSTEPVAWEPGKFRLPV